MDSGGSGFCPERSPFMREYEQEWRYRQAGYAHHHLDHHSMHTSRMYMEKMEPSSSSELYHPHSSCRCYACSSSSSSMMSRVRPHSMFPDGPEWCHQVKKSCSELPFSIRTPVRKDAPPMLQSDSPCNAAPSSLPPRMCMGYSPQAPGFMSYSVDRHKACQPKSSENQINLHRWFLIKLRDDRTTVALGGFVNFGYDLEFVKTDPVVDRIEKGRLKTRGGVEVRLLGQMDDEATVANGFSSSLAHVFFTGFPCMWKRYLEDFFAAAALEEENAEKASSPVVDKKSGDDQGTCPATPVTQPAEVQAEQNEANHSGGAACSTPPVKENLEESGAEDQAEVKVVEDAPAAKPPQRKRAPSRLPTRSSKRLKEKESQESDGSNEKGEAEQGAEGRRECEEDEVVKEVDTRVSSLEAPELTIPVAEPEIEVAEEHTREQEVEEVVVVEVPAPAEAPAPQQQTRPVSNGRKRSRRQVTKSRRKRKVTTRKTGEAIASGDNEEVTIVDDDEENEPPREEPEAAPQVTEHSAPAAEDVAEVNERETEVKPNPDEEDAKASETEKELELEEVEEEAQEVKIDLSEPRPAEDEEAGAEEAEVKVTKRSVRKRGSGTRKTSRSRKPKKESERRPAPAVEAESEEPPEPKPETKQVNRRSKRSALPPPLPAARVAKSEVIEAYGLKQSRSGRLLVPPLAYWRNQTLALDKDGGIIAIMDGFAEPPSDTGIFNFKPPSGKKRLQEKLCAAAATDARSSIDVKGKKKVRGSK